MFDRLRAFWNRLTREPRYPEAPRVSTSSRTMAGVNITPDNAITVPAVWACGRYLQQTVAQLPWHVILESERGSELQLKHPTDWLIYKRPNPEWSSFQFRETLLHWALFQGNGYAEIERSQIDTPFALWPIHPERVECCRAVVAMTSSSGRAIRADELYYEVSNGDGPDSIIAAADMFHIRGFGHGPVGVNIIHYAAQSIGWARAAQLFGASFFGNGANVSGIVTNKSAIGPGGLALQKTEFDLLTKGIKNAHKVVHLGGDGDFKRIGMNAEESQLVEVHQHLVEEICRWFGVPPHKVSHLLRATFSNIEHQAIEVVVDSVMPWVKRFEDEADIKLFGQNRRNLCTKMNLRGLLRGDFKSQNEGLQIARQNGIINADEWRELLDMNKLPPGEGGDKYLMQSQYMTLDKIGDGVAAGAPAEKPIEKPGADDNDEEDDDLEADADDPAVAAKIDTIARLLAQEPVHAE